MDADVSLTTREVAKFLNISNQMVYNLIKANELPAFKVGAAVRVLQSDLQQYVKTRKSLYNAQTKDLRNDDDSVFSAQSVFVRAGTFLVQDVSFSVPKGRIMTVLGPSGCGKTLLLKALAGILPLEAGGVFLGTRRLDTLSPAERHIGFVYQEYALYPNMKTSENIGFPLQFLNMDKKKIDEEFRAVVEELKIDDAFLRRYPDELPEGIKQLAAVGREKTHAIDLYILDEPMSHLDAKIRAGMRSFIKQFVTRLGKTTIIAVNSPEDALALSDYTGIMDRGKLVQFGLTQDIYERPVNLEAMNALSSIGVNCLPVEISGGRVEGVGLTAEEADGTYLMAFRPQEIEIAERGIPVKTVRTTFYDGRRNLAVCRTGEGREVRLLVPVESEEELSFLPTKPIYFPA